jgi:hypothetical protein
MKGIQVFNRPASYTSFEVAGRLLFIECFDLPLGTLIERLFAGWQLTPVSVLERNTQVKISFFGREAVPEIPRGMEEFEVAHGGRCFYARDQFYLKFDNSLMRLEEGEPVKIAVWTSVLDSTNPELGRVTSFAVCAALRRFGLFDIHSAGVVVPETEAGVLIIGPSGSGKSTLTLQLARAGWGYLSDDEMWLSLSAQQFGGQVEARGFRSFFALSQSAPENGVRPAFKNCFEPANVFSAPRVPQVAPRFLLFTSISGDAETQLHALTQAETMTRLIRASPWATYDTSVAGSNLQLLSQLARQTKGFDLDAGHDLLDPARASEIISSVCSA